MPNLLHSNPLLPMWHQLLSNNQWLNQHRLLTLLVITTTVCFHKATHQQMHKVTPNNTILGSKLD
jgi:hypothetical protein